jgi:predicted enzyme related to lactoylglutathione lyase
MWLAHVAVDNIDKALAVFGGPVLGPIQREESGDTALTIDPGGAVVALTTAAATPYEIRRAVLSTPDVPATARAYGEVAGWCFGAPETVAGVELLPFAATRGGPIVGGLAAIAGRTGVHPAWNLHFAVRDVDAAAGRVRSLGGLALPPIDLPAARIVVCDDPWGAMFSLEQDVSGAELAGV